MYKSDGKQMIPSTLIPGAYTSPLNFPGLGTNVGVQPQPYLVRGSIVPEIPYQYDPRSSLVLSLLRWRCCCW